MSAAAGAQPRETGQINGRFCVARAAEHSLVLGVERVDVARTAEPFGLRLRVGQRADGCAAVVGGDSGSAPFKQVDAHGEGRSEHRGVVLDHRHEIQLAAALKA